MHYGKLSVFFGWPILGIKSHISQPLLQWFCPFLLFIFLWKIPLLHGSEILYLMDTWFKVVWKTCISHHLIMAYKGIRNTYINKIHLVAFSRAFNQMSWSSSVEEFCSIDILMLCFLSCLYFKCTSSSCGVSTILSSTYTLPLGASQLFTPPPSLSDLM